MITLSLVIPCYNEEEVLPETVRRLEEILNGLRSRNVISPQSRMIFVDDGSADATWALIERFSAQNAMVQGIKLAHNAGHQNALLAGLFSAAGDAVITLDADLQDDLGAIERMIEAYLAGHEIVYGVRDDRASDSFGKRASAEGYYRILKLLGVSIVFNHADYRLMGRRAIEALKQFREVNLFLRGIVPLLGFKSTTVYYTRQKRFAGESKYPLRKMLALALDGVTSFSNTPLRLIFLMGLCISFISFLIGCYSLLATYLLPDHIVPGWASTVLPIYFIGGIQILCLGVIGEYLGKIYLESKSRPRYIIEATTGDTR